MDLLQIQMKALGLPIPEKEYRFAPPRRWRADYFFANQVRPLAVEVEGGLYSGGRHVRGKGAENDMAKYNEMSIMGISLLRFTPQQVEKGEAAQKIREFFDGRNEA